jgi:outer membrane autotransporter protein
MQGSIMLTTRSATIATTHLAAYAGANYGPWNLRSGATIGWSRLDTSRMILFPGFADSASARYNASTAQVFGEVGYGIALGTIAAEPFAGLAWVHLSTDGFNETGGSGDAALVGLQSSDDVGYSTLGARVAANYLLPGGAVLIPRASVAWQHAFGDVGPAAAPVFQGTGAALTISGGAARGRRRAGRSRIGPAHHAAGYRRLFLYRPAW